MDSSKLVVNQLYTIHIWDTYSSPAGWKKMPALFLGEEAGQVRFLIRVRAENQTRNLDDTLAEYNLAEDHWAVYADRAEHVAEKEDCFHFVNTLGARKTSYRSASNEGQRFEKLARAAGLIR